MDYIREELERQRLALELLLAPPAVHLSENALSEETAAVGQRVAAEGELAQYGRRMAMEMAGGSQMLADMDGAPAGYSGQVLAGAEKIAALVTAVERRENRAAMRQKLAERADAVEIGSGTAAASEKAPGFRTESRTIENVAAAYEKWMPVRAQETAARLAAQEVSRAVERDARRYDGGYQMY